MMYRVYRMFLGVKCYIQSGSVTEFTEKQARELASRTVDGRSLYLIERVEG